MKSEAAVKSRVVEANRGCWKGPTYPEFVAPACMVDNAQMTAAHKAVEEQTQREHGTTLRIGCIHLNV